MSSLWSLEQAHTYLFLSMSIPLMSPESHLMAPSPHLWETPPNPRLSGQLTAFHDSSYNQVTQYLCTHPAPPLPRVPMLHRLPILACNSVSSNTIGRQPVHAAWASTPLAGPSESSTACSVPTSGTSLYCIMPWFPHVSCTWAYQWEQFSTYKALIPGMTHSKGSINIICL